MGGSKMGQLFSLLLIILLFTFAYYRLQFKTITSLSILYLLLLTIFSGFSYFFLAMIWFVFLIILLPLNIPQIRKTYITRPLFTYASKILPTLSKTEEQAL